MIGRSNSDACNMSIVHGVNISLTFFKVLNIFNSNAWYNYSYNFMKVLRRKNYILLALKIVW